MFDVGFAELFLLSLIGLLVLGPERLPAVARTLGVFARKARNSWYNLKHSVETELAASDMSEPLKNARDELQAVSRSVSDLGKEMEQPPATGAGAGADAPEADSARAKNTTTETPAEDKEAQVPEDRPAN